MGSSSSLLSLSTGTHCTLERWIPIALRQIPNSYGRTLVRILQETCLGSAPGTDQCLASLGAKLVLSATPQSIADPFTTSLGHAVGAFGLNRDEPPTCSHHTLLIISSVDHHAPAICTMESRSRESTFGEKIRQAHQNWIHDFSTRWGYVCIPWSTFSAIVVTSDLSRDPFLS